MTQVSINTLVEGAISGNYIVSFPTDTVPALAVEQESPGLLQPAKEHSHFGCEKPETTKLPPKNP